MDQILGYIKELFIIIMTLGKLNAINCINTSTGAYFPNGVYQSIRDKMAGCRGICLSSFSCKRRV